MLNLQVDQQTPTSTESSARIKEPEPPTAPEHCALPQPPPLPADPNVEDFTFRLQLKKMDDPNVGLNNSVKKLSNERSRLDNHFV